MKKYVLTFIVLFISITIFLFDNNTIYGSNSNSGADSIDVAGISTNNVLDNNANVWWWVIDGSDTNDYNVQGSYIQPLLKNGFDYYFRGNSNRLLIGATSQPGFGASPYKLYVNGRGYFSDDLYLGTKLRLGGSSAGYLDYSSSTLYFYDETTGLKSLSELASSGSSINLNNGLSVVGEYGILGGTLNQSTDIYNNGYTFTIGESGNPLLSINPTGDTWTKGYSTNYMLGDDINIFASGSFRLYSQSSGENMFRDYTSTPYGLNLYAWDTYWNNIQNDNQNEAFMSYGMVKDIDSLNNVDTANISALNSDTIVTDALWINGSQISGKVGDSSWASITSDTINTGVNGLTIKYGAYEGSLQPASSKFDVSMIGGSSLSLGTSK